MQMFLSGPLNPRWFTVIAAYCFILFLQDHGYIAFNDSVLMEASLYKLLRKHIRHKSYYADVMDLFHEVTGVTSDCAMISINYNIC